MLKKLLLTLFLLPLTVYADNVAVTEGSGKTIGFDDISGVNIQRVKPIFGSDGTNAGDVATGNPFPVQIRTSGGTEAIVNLGKAEDTAHSSGDLGVQCLSVRSDTAAATSGTDGDYQPLITDSTGRLHVNTGTVTVTDGSGALNTIVDSSALPSGASTSAKQPALGTAGTASSDVITVQGIASMTALTVSDGSGAMNVIVDSGSLTCNAGTNLNTSALATAAKQPALGTAGSASTDVISVQGIASMTALKVDGSAVTQPVSGTVTVTDGSGALNVIVDSGTVSTITNVVHVDDNSGSLTVDNGGTFAVQSSVADGANVTLGAKADAKSTATDTTAVTAMSVLKQISASVQAPPSQAVTNAGTFAVQAAQSGTWTVQPGNTANTTAWLTQNTPATSGGYTTYHLVSANTTNATVVKASAGQLYGWYIYNSNAAMRKICFHNASSTPTAGASIFFCLPLPAGAAANVFTDTGIPFSTGISFTTVTDLTDAGTTAVGTSDLNINLFYK